jgi:hypothetical protein
MDELLVRRRLAVWAAGVALIAGPLFLGRAMGPAAWHEGLRLIGGLLFVADGLVQATNWRGITERYRADRARGKRTVHGLAAHRLTGVGFILIGFVTVAAAARALIG